ncbi:MAG: 5'-deoxynucleotidase [Clostridia bacterium]|nr:5'-deoxynucleotidase [Clostridia bacterium]
MNNGFYAMLFRMKHIKRWGIMHSLIPDYLSTHSLEVAFIAHSLAIVGNTYFGKSYNCDAIAVKAMYHDVPEIFTGDIPTPVKYFSDETKSAYSSVESASLNKLSDMLPNDFRDKYVSYFEHTGEEHTLIKAADRISAYIKCMEEKNYGNREFEIAGERLLLTVKEMKCEEADYFLKHFLEPFGLPIDSIIEKE